MRTLFLISLFFLFSSNVYCQHCYGENLIPNPSLDSFSICPDNGWQIDRAVPWTQPLYQSASSAVNQCMFDGNPTQMDTAGYRKINWRSEGMAYLIIWEDWSPWRTYIEVPLKHSLEAEQCYYGEFWVLTHNVSREGIDAIGMYFSDTLVKVKSDTIIGGDTIGLIKPVYALPQISNPTGHILKDTANWEKVSGTFVATGTETAMIMGCLRPDSEVNYQFITGTFGQSARYMFDDFLLCKCEDTIPPDTVKPVTPALEVYPNPANENLFILFNGYDQLQTIDLEVYNILGELVMNKQIFSSDAPTSINIGPIASGCYAIVLKNGSRILYKDKLIVIK